MNTPTLPTDPKLLMRSIIQRIATGPDLSKDISRLEAHLGTKAIIDNHIDPIQVGIYFIALRMKRETLDENRGALDAPRSMKWSTSATRTTATPAACPPRLFLARC